MKLSSPINKSNYRPTRHDLKVMSACLKVGYKIFPDFLKTQAWVRHNPLVILVGVLRNQRRQLIESPFDQRYIGYYTYMFYNKFYEKNILTEIKVKKPIVVQKMTFPPPPPAKELLPPPPLN